MPYQQIRKNQPTIVNRFGKPNPQNQPRQDNNDYETMKEVCIFKDQTQNFYIWTMFF